jgi:hypothetical protein
MNDPGGLRASDAEREAVVEQLREASVEGRLTLAELTERTEAAYLAATHAELAQVTADLPGTAGHLAPAPAASSPDRPGKKRRWYVAVMGDSKRRGKWRVDDEIGAVAVMGDVTIDLREAEVRSNEVEVLAISVMGDVKIIVPDGVDVDLSGVAIMGDKKVQVVEAPSGQNVPVIRVRAYAVMGNVKIIGDSRAEPIRRAWFAWSEWWWERRGEQGRDPRGMWRPLSHGDRENLRELRREARDQFRDVRRDARDRLREIRRGDMPRPPRAPRPPTPPEPPRW